MKLINIQVMIKVGNLIILSLWHRLSCMLKVPALSPDRNEDSLQGWLKGDDCQIVYLSFISLPQSIFIHRDGCSVQDYRKMQLFRNARGCKLLEGTTLQDLNKLRQTSLR